MIAIETTEIGTGIRAYPTGPRRVWRVVQGRARPAVDSEPRLTGRGGPQSVLCRSGVRWSVSVHLGRSFSTYGQPCRWAPPRLMVQKASFA